MNDEIIEIGGKRYSLSRIAELEAEYGEGFLDRNPHFPAPGGYLNADGSQSYPGPKTLAQLRHIQKHDA